MATTKIERTFTAGNPDRWTFSTWLKRGNLGQKGIFSGYNDAANRSDFLFDSSDRLEFQHLVGNSITVRLITNRKFRDLSAWYHIVLVWDTGNATAGNRTRFYVNGVEETSFSTDTQATQNLDSHQNVNGNTCIVGRMDTGIYFDGEMSHVQFVDGLQLTPTEFGEFDSVSGIWKIKTGSYATPGTNGFHLKMEDRANLDLDSSSNAHTFTTTGTLTPTCDNPSNNFATFDNLTPYSLTSFLGHERANTRTGTNGGISYLNLLPNKGKWFVEYHINTAGVNQDNGVGFWSVMEAQTYVYYQTDFRGIVWKYAGNVYVDGVNNSFSSDTFTSGDIISIAMDFDNDQATFYKNGTVATNLNNYSYNFSNHSTVSTGIMDGASSPAEDGIFDLNAGQNPTFGGRKTAGTNADANGHGLFSMAVPSGFYAICTKNIKLYGG